MNDSLPPSFPPTPRQPPDKLIDRYWFRLTFVCVAFLVLAGTISGIIAAANDYSFWAGFIAIEVVILGCAVCLALFVGLVEGLIWVSDWVSKGR